MRVWFIAVALAAVGVLDGRTVVLAQYNNSGTSYGSGQSYNSLSGQQGMFGTRTFGSNLTPGQRSFSGQSFGNQGSFDFSNTNRQPGDFVGVNSQNTQNFVGVGQAGTQANSMSGLGGLLQQMMGRQNYRNRTRNAGQNASAPTGQTANPIRSTLCVAFDYTATTANGLSTSLSHRLAATPSIHTQTPIQVEVQGQTAILQGVVTTEHDRVLAEHMVRLEPGIGVVQNEIVVEKLKPKSATPTLSPQPTLPQSVPSEPPPLSELPEPPNPP